MTIKSTEESQKMAKKRAQEATNALAKSEKERRDIAEKFEKTDKERAKINEKYIKLS